MMDERGKQPHLGMIYGSRVLPLMGAAPRRGLGRRRSSNTEPLRGAGRPAVTTALCPCLAQLVPPSLRAMASPEQRCSHP